MMMMMQGGCWGVKGICWHTYSSPGEYRELGHTKRT